MSTLLSEFRDPLRLLLGDMDPLENYQFTDDHLERGVRAVFQCGLQPTEDNSATTAEYALNDAGTAISPTVPSGDDFALIAYRAAKLLVMGQDGAISYRTRALSVNDRGDRKKDLMRELELLIHRIEGGLCVFASQRSFVLWLNNQRGASIEKETVAT